MRIGAPKQLSTTSEDITERITSYIPYFFANYITDANTDK
jgi:hypothetical protein